MLVGVEEDAHEGGSESDHLLVDAGIGSVEVEVGVLLADESLVEGADEANIADAPLEASVVAGEVWGLIEVAREGALGWKPLMALEKSSLAL